MHLIDYEDMVKLGETESPTIDITKPKFAIFIKTATGMVGKYNVVNPEATKRSIYAFRRHKDELSGDVKEKVAYFLKQAAVHHDVAFSFKTKPFKDNIIPIEDVIEKEASPQKIVVEIMSTKYDLTDEFMRKQASTAFINNEKDISPYDRVAIAHEIVKQAGNREIPEDIKVYDEPSSIGTRADDEFFFRKTASRNKDYINSITELEKYAKDMSPTNFLQAVQSMDELSDINFHGRPYSNFLKNNPTKPLSKNASSGEKGVSFIESLILD